MKGLSPFKLQESCTTMIKLFIVYIINQVIPFITNFYNKHKIETGHFWLLNIKGNDWNSIGEKHDKQTLVQVHVELVTVYDFTIFCRLALNLSGDFHLHQ